MTRFFDRFREALTQWAEGVHRLGPPADPEAIEGLPGEYRDFLSSWDGAELFHEDVRIYPARDTHVGEETPIGESAGGDTFALDREGRVIEQEAETGLRWICASTFERWLDAVMAQGAAVYDRDGEFREGVFEGEELAPEIELKLSRKKAKLDPDSPKWRYELGMALSAAGKRKEAERELERAVELDPDAVWAWFELGRLRLPRDPAGAEQAFARAATPEGDMAGYFLAWAARAALAAGDAKSAEQHRKRALALDPQVVSRQLEAARHELEVAERPDEARELCELALAVAPRDMQALDLRRRLGPKR